MNPRLTTKTGKRGHGVETVRPRAELEVSANRFAVISKDDEPEKQSVEDLNKLKAPSKEAAPRRQKQKSRAPSPEAEGRPRRTCAHPCQHHPKSQVMSECLLATSVDPASQPKQKERPGTFEPINIKHKNVIEDPEIAENAWWSSSQSKMKLRCSMHAMSFWPKRLTSEASSPQICSLPVLKLQSNPPLSLMAMRTT